jgi:5-methylcytosine-specific restriction endonuclease McrA
MEIIGREAAKAAGMKKYFTGKPCPHGHVAFRWVAGFNCSVCLDISKKAYRADPEFHARELAYKAEYRNANRDKANEYAAWYWRNHPNAKIVDAEQKEKHKESRNEYNRKYAADRPEYSRQRNAEWRAKNPDAVRAYISSRRAREMDAEGCHTAKDIRLIFFEQNGQCCGCLGVLQKGYHVDHVMPLILGGSNWPDNLQLLCPSCNSRKNAMHPLDWFAQINKAYLA